MKVKKFIQELEDKYSPDDELYFTTGAGGCEHTFDNVEVCPKDDFSQETDVYLSFDKRNREEFENAVAGNLAIDIREALNNIVNKYL